MHAFLWTFIGLQVFGIVLMPIVIGKPREPITAGNAVIRGISSCASIAWAGYLLLQT